MRASVVDLRYRMKEVLQALRRQESVEILYHNKVMGTIVPAKKHKIEEASKAHPFFGMYSHDTKKSVKETMKELRGGRFRAL